jgi:glycosyltransferase involved in cell wall biosynthesis
MKLSVVMPVYNEEATILSIVQRVRDVRIEGIEQELIIIDDCSKDGTRKEIEKLQGTPGIVLLFHEKNRGKGAALRTGFTAATGDMVIVQDADLEYDPQEFPRLIKPILDGKADVVFGSRFVGGDCHRVLYFRHMLGNKVLTFMSNWFTNLNLTDMEVCYKVFRRPIIQGITLEEDRFGFEPEVTAKVARLKCRIYEVGISYAGRTYEEGKKIGWKDGVRAIWCILKYNLLR